MAEQLDKVHCYKSVYFHNRGNHHRVKTNRCILGKTDLFYLVLLRLRILQPALFSCPQSSERMRDVLTAGKGTRAVGPVECLI